MAAKIIEASEAETQKDAKEVLPKTDEVPMEDRNIKDTNTTKIQDLSTRNETIDNDNAISMDVAATKDTKETDEETKTTITIDLQLDRFQQSLHNRFKVRNRTGFVPGDHQGG